MEQYMTQYIDNSVYFARKNDDVKMPTKRAEDGCYDIYAFFNEEEVTIMPHTNKLISTGLHSACDPGYRLSLRERGSNTKWGAQILGGQIDSGYRGEIFVSIYNSNDYPIVISKNKYEIQKIYGNDAKIETIYFPYTKAICQLAIEYVPQVPVFEMPLETLLTIPSEREEGALGSTNK